ncbi:MAG TPA: iron donor protein CyaY [Dongiaceae bacterium]
MMDQAGFERQAAALLEGLFDRIEAAFDDLEVDYEAGILTVKLPDGRTYLLNKHAPNREIWLSSPVSGAWHFAFDPAVSLWRSTRPVASGSDDLLAMFRGELSALTGLDIDLAD